MKCGLKYKNLIHALSGGACRILPMSIFIKTYQASLIRWHKSKQATKMGIGRFFIAIDKNLQGYRADNAYRFVERVSASNLPRDTQVNYRVQEREIQSLRSEVEACTQQIQQLTSNYKKMKRELDRTKHALKDLTNSKRFVEQQCDHHQRQAKKFKECFTSMVCEYNTLEAVL